MAYTTINKSSDYFDTRTYSASGAGSISDVSFQPDFMWFKNRTIAGDHGLMDAVRGVNGIIHSNDTNAEVTSNGTTNITAFTSNGFTYGASSLLDTGSGTPVTWLWKANGAGSANTDGSISSTVSANTTSGFSIVSYTGTGSNATVGHGLGVAPKMFILKNRSSGDYNWSVWHGNLSTPTTARIAINTNSAQQNHSSYWNNSIPDTTILNLGTDAGHNGSGNSMIAYCFAEIPGYSKFGKIKGNGNNDGPFCYLGFSPSFMLYKKIGTGDWYIMDNKRPGYNDNDKRLYTNTSQAEETYDLINLYSNGFKLTNTTHTYTNDSDSEYLYMAWGQSIVGSNNVPATAR